MAIEHSFPTFCHIGEYGESGYANLHRMIAVSQPLNLWAPTSTLLGSRDCQVSRDEFLEYVDSGHIRVFGRERWLTSKTERNKFESKYSNAAWDENFDGWLQRILDQDSGKPLQDRRVVIADAEKGKDRALQLVDENPSHIDYWNNPANQRKIPSGTLEAARRTAKGDPAAFARAVLRDAWNHGEASRDAGAEVRFLLTLKDRQFLDVLMRAAIGREGSEGANQTDSALVRATAQARRAVPTTVSDRLSQQLLELLGTLDDSAPHRGHPGSLHRFLGGKKHRALVAWLSSMCEQYKYHNTKVLDKAVINELLADLGRAEFRTPLRELASDPAGRAVGAIGLAIAIMTADPTSPLTLGGIFAATFPVTAGLSRATGITPPSFSGPQWPFLYTYGSRARKNQYEHLVYVLRKAAQK
jgi:hypothetical protein